MSELAGQRVLVLGLGVSGRSAARYLADRGARVTAADEGAPERIGNLDELTGRVELHLGQPFPNPEDFDLIVPSPGVPAARWANAGVPAWGDVELAFRALAVPVIAVTGTNGKTTATLLIEAMLRAAGWRAEAAGNLGRPALELVGRALDAAVLEVSSFQLEAVEAFRPRVAVVLNVAPDHLDRHGSFESYVDAKARLLHRQEAQDHAVLNGDCETTRSLAARTRARVAWFRTRGPVECGAFWDAEAVVLCDPPRAERLLAPTAGELGIETVLAALLAVRALGAEPEKALHALSTFRRPPHRREPVLERNGVLWVNDSKATNPLAAEHALRAAGRPVIWIAGGRGKGTGFGALAEAAAGCVREAILIGEAAGELEGALTGRVSCARARDLEEAVIRAVARARPGDCVLFSPACASFDQFRNFEDRGERFRAAVVRHTATREGSGAGGTP